MSKLTNSPREAQDALASGLWVLEHTKRGTMGDALQGATYEIFDDWKPKKFSAPRLGARHKKDMSGGFTPGMRVRLSETATARHWVAGVEKIVKHPARGKVGTVEYVTDADNLLVSVVFDECKDAGGLPVAMVCPGDWLRLA